MDNAALRRHIASLLDWNDAHATFDQAVSGIPHDLRGRQPAGLPYSPWQLLEHLRLAQRDILEFCTSAGYEEPAWPDDYWPAGPAPRYGEWEQSMESFRADREALKQLALDVDLFASIPHGTGQTYLRELLLVADHNAYHIGELIVVRRLLGNWT
jgi:hypothetical protein